MRRMVDSDDESGDQRKSDPEVTLGMASLLGIFFGLVILCGIFFGFGYSVGKRFTAPSSPAATHATKRGAADGAVAEEPQTTKPSATGPESHPTVAPAPPTQLERPSKKPSIEAAEMTSAPVQQPELRPSPSSRAFPDYMVQIAAVSRSADGDVLIAALRKRGYNVSAHTEPQDKLLHVQIGPFTTRAEANAMRQKLLADGYNAIIK